MQIIPNYFLSFENLSKNNPSEKLELESMYKIMIKIVYKKIFFSGA